MAGKQDKKALSIRIWAGPSQHWDPTTHFWYEGKNAKYFRLCDDVEWKGESLIANKATAPSPYVPCRACKELYANDMVIGEQLLNPHDSVVYSPLNGGYTIETEGTLMTTVNIAPRISIATFARFYEATGPQKVTIVRDARTFQIDPDGYKKRDFYWDFRNTLRKTHWQTGDITTFEVALEPLISRQKEAGKREHYQTLGRAYIDYWTKRGAEYFDVQRTSSDIDLAGLTVHVFPEVGMRYHGDNLAVRMWLNAQHSTRPFRQVTHYLTEQAKQLGWKSDWQSGLWDVRREELLPVPPIPKDFALALEAQAVAFQRLWERISKVEE